jgi:hypothetical protein
MSLRFGISVPLGCNGATATSGKREAERVLEDGKHGDLLNDHSRLSPSSLSQEFFRGIPQHNL